MLMHSFPNSKNPFEEPEASQTQQKRKPLNNKTFAWNYRDSGKRGRNGKTETALCKYKLNVMECN